jgi:hypothetical protein
MDYRTKELYEKIQQMSPISKRLNKRWAIKDVEVE